ncbi:LuxR C-terminal-related transcriptional regulator [Caballeronia sp. BR00000012568055]|uniref:LuxR C-terminal-related transcriptional regulator n=1 Tax=Caballeronia sp. BR00000012568055 TaxID=2918761 RepID=UPI0023F8FEE4|nr:LuxR C-terminal-related transcriptional regulator [Caballeronia sp. BR00000012568055]
MDVQLIAPAGLFRDGLAALLRAFAADVSVQAHEEIAQAKTGASGAACMIMDGDAPGRARHEAACEMARAIPAIVLLDEARRQEVDQLIADGFAGCVEKSASAEMLFGALHVVLAGGVYLPRAVLAAQAQSPSDGDGRTRENIKRRIGQADPHAHLTPRQIEVLALLARGRSNKMIARELKVSEATVKTHLTTIFKVLNVASRGEASAAAARIEKIRGSQVNSAMNGHIYLGRLLANMESQHFRAGEVLFRKGDASGALFYVEKGTVKLAGLGIELGAGSVLGEIGLFSPEHRRTSTVVCKTACEMRTVSAADAVRLYYQEPEFAFHLLRLIVERLQADQQRGA